MLEYLDNDDIGKLALGQHKAGNPVEAFYDYMEDRQLEELAIRKARKKESIEDMLEYLDGDSLKSIMRELLS